MPAARYVDGSGIEQTAPTTFDTKAGADRFLARVQVELMRGEWRDPRLGEITFTAWVDEWLASTPGKRATTRARDLSVLRTHFLPALGDLPLAAITPTHVRRVVDGMAERLASATVRTNLGVLRAVLNAAVEADLIARSPVRGVRLPECDSEERPTLTPAELLGLAEAVNGRYRALVLVAGVLGLRWSECIALRVGDVDFLRRTVTIGRTIAEVSGHLTTAAPKSRASRRTISVPGFVLEAVAMHIAEHRLSAESDDLLFTGPRGGVLSRRFGQRVFAPAVERAGFDPALTFHGLRHVATSLMVEAGEHPRVIQHRLGHATARLSLELYAHVPEPADRDVARRLDERFTDATSGDEAFG